MYLGAKRRYINTLPFLYPLFVVSVTLGGAYDGRNLRRGGDMASATSGVEREPTGA